MLPSKYTCQRHPDVWITCTSHGSDGHNQLVSVRPCTKCIAGVPSELHSVTQQISVAAGSRMANAHVGGFCWTDYDEIGEPTGTGAASGGDIQNYYKAWRRGKLRIEETT